MKSKGFRHLPVVENKKIIGILSMRDLYDYAHNELQDSLKKHQEFMFGTGMAVNLKFLLKARVSLF